MVVSAPAAVSTAERADAASVPAVAELLRIARRLLVDLLQGQQTLKAELEDSTAEAAPQLPTVSA